jgi:hypothetical protein
MAKKRGQFKKEKLALALAQGQSVAAWAVQNGVSERQVYRWAKEREVKDDIIAHRRYLVEQSVGLLAEKIAWAASGIINLGEHAQSESVKLSALKAVMTTMITGSQYAGMDQRMTELEERFNARDRLTANAPEAAL